MLHRGVTTRERERERAIVRSSRDVDVRFLKSILGFFRKSYFPCDQRQCPAIKERLKHHHRVRHPSAPGHHPGPQNTGIRGRPVMASSQVSRQYVTTGIGPDRDDRHNLNDSRLEQHNTRAFNANTGNYEEIQTIVVKKEEEDPNIYDNQFRRNADGYTTISDDDNLSNFRYHKGNERDAGTGSLRNGPIKAINYHDKLFKTKSNEDWSKFESNRNVEKDASITNVSNPYEYKKYAKKYSTTNDDYGEFNDTQYDNTDNRPSTSVKNQNHISDNYGNGNFTDTQNDNYEDRPTSAKERSYNDNYGKSKFSDTTCDNSDNKPTNTKIKSNNNENYGNGILRDRQYDNFDNGPTSAKAKSRNNDNCDNSKFSNTQYDNSDHKPTTSAKIKSNNNKNNGNAKLRNTQYDNFDNGPKNAKSKTRNKDHYGNGKFSDKQYVNSDDRTTTRGKRKSHYNDKYGKGRFSDKQYDSYDSKCISAKDKSHNNDDYGTGKFRDTQHVNLDNIPKMTDKRKIHNNDNYGTIPLDLKIERCISNTTILSSFDSNTKYGIKIPYTFESSSKSETPSAATTTINNNSTAPKLHKKQELNKSSRYSREYPFQKEVKEWFQELPLFPSLGKESKEDRINAKNNLIINLNNLAIEAKDTEYREKARNEIDECLKKLPIWYPGDKIDQNTYKNSLIDKLLVKIEIKNSKIIDETSAATISNSKVSNLITKPNVKHKTNKISNRNASIGKVVKYDEIKNTVMEWLYSIYPIKSIDNTHMKILPQIADFVIDGLSPLLRNPVRTKNRKLVLKDSILKILGDIPLNIRLPEYRHLHLLNCAENLADRVFNIQAKYVKRSNNTNISTALTNGFTIFDSTQREFTIYCEVRKCFEDANINCTNIVIQEASVILLEFIEMPDPEGETDAKNAIIYLLVTSANISDAQACIVAKTIIEKVKNIMDECQITPKLQSDKSRQLYPVSVYSSSEKFSSLKYPFTSTPKNKSVKKTIPKLNPQEIQYMEKVANLIRVWIDTLPENFSAPEEQNFKETMIQDLAGDIMDEVKLDQLAPRTKDRQKKNLHYTVYRWIYRLNVFDLQEVKPQIKDFLNRLEDIPVPIMTQPQHGNRQAMANIIHFEDGHWENYFLPKGHDILQDEISIWMNEQPSYIFANNDQISRNKQIKELAQVLEFKLANKRPQVEILTEVAQWLHNMVKPEEIYEIGELTENLKGRVIRLPQDATLAANYNKRLKDYLHFFHEQAILPTCIHQRSGNDSVDQEQTMQIFISKYLQHNYDIDDPLARRAFNRLLATYLQRLDLSKRKEVYDNFGKSAKNYGFLPKIIISELEYIKDISDWLKTLPINASFKESHDCIDFIISLAISIREVEEERYNDPSAMDYNIYIGSIILQFLQELPILEEYCDDQNINHMINKLVGKIKANRQTVTSLIRKNETLNTTGVNPDNIGDFIEEFILINGDNIAQDEVKLEAWAIRLIREIKKIMRDNEGSFNKVIPKAYIYNELIDVPIPGNETANLFSLELEYVTEIANWLKNLPLLPIIESEEDGRVRIICELAEKMIEIERKRAVNPNDTRVNEEFKNYLAKWITDLPLDKKQEIIIPIVIQQLMNRMERVKQKHFLPGLFFSQSNKSIERTSSIDTYILNLENTIEVSIPYPLSHKHAYDPGLEIYKHRLATKFILDNFDQGTDIVKTKYENLLKKEIDAYFEFAKKQNAVPISKDEMYNELYAALFKVSIPNEESIIKEVEEIKTRCEIDAWFEELPLQEAHGVSELLQWDEILSTLARQIHEIERSEIKNDEKILNEILKCLAKFPLRTVYKNQQVKFAKTLQILLKSTELQRKCIVDSKTSKRKELKMAEVKELASKQKEDNQVAGPSSSGKMWTSLPEPQQIQESMSPRKKASDEMYEIVQDRCNQILVNAAIPWEQENDQTLNDDVGTINIIKTSELNPAFFIDESKNNEILKRVSKSNENVVGPTIGSQILSGSYQSDDDVEVELIDVFGSENEEEQLEERICPFRLRLRRPRSFPCCMIPMKFICGNFEGYNIFWRRILFPSYI